MKAQEGWKESKHVLVALCESWVLVSHFSNCMGETMAWSPRSQVGQTQRTGRLQALRHCTQRAFSLPRPLGILDTAMPIQSPRVCRAVVES